LTLDGEVDVVGPDGTRTIPAAELFTGVFQTSLGPQEILTEVRVPKLTGDHGWSYLKFRRRSADWATVGAAVVVKGNGTIEEAAVGLVSMGATPLRARVTERALLAGESDPAAAADEGTDPPTDTNGTAEFRRHLARVLVARALQEARPGRAF
jgi:carbon-monoxide dehydrogenase medium subunit